MFGNNTKKWSVILKNRNKNRKILTNCWKFSDIFIFFIYLSAYKENSVFSRSSANFGEESRSRGVIKSIPRGIEEWKKVRDLEDRGTRNSSCPMLDHRYLPLYSQDYYDSRYSYHVSYEAAGGWALPVSPKLRLESWPVGGPQVSTCQKTITKHERTAKMLI